MSQPRPGASSRVVQGAQHGAIRVQVGVDLALVPDVVAAGDDVNPVREQLLRQAGGQAGPGSQVLAVGDHQVEVQLGAQLAQGVA